MSAKRPGSERAASAASHAPARASVCYENRRVSSHVAAVLKKTRGFRACYGASRLRAAVPRPRLGVLRKSAGSLPLGGGCAKNTRGFRARIAPAAPGHRASGPWTPRQWPRPRQPVTLPPRHRATATTPLPVTGHRDEKKARRKNPPRFEGGRRFNVDRLPATLAQSLFRSPRNLAPIAHGWTQHACHNAATPPRNDALTTPRHDTRCHSSPCTPCWT